MAEPSPALPDMMRTKMRAEAAGKRSAIYLECPEFLRPVIKQAAKENLTSASAYVRGAILSQLRRDGFDPKDAA
jgi:hypothetical protein